MKKSSIVDVINLTLCILGVLLTVLFSWSMLTSPVYNEQTADPIESPCMFDGAVEVQPTETIPETLDPEPTESIKPFEVAEPLQGKDLYIFQLSQICEQYYPEVDPYIALAVMETESQYNPDVQSSAGAVGLMQVIPKYHARRAEKYGLTDIWDPYANIIAGVDFLNELYQTYGSWPRALLGYNNSTRYVSHVLAKADSLRGGNIFG